MPAITTFTNLLLAAHAHGFGHSVCHTRTLTADSVFTEWSNHCYESPCLVNGSMSERGGGQVGH